MKQAEQYILNQSEPARLILLQLQLIIELTIPTAVLLYKYKIPFYYLDGKQPFCFLNYTKGYVDLGLWHGAHLTKHKEKLVTKGRKHMKSLRFFNCEEIDEVVLIDLLNEAYSFKDKPYYK